MPGADLLAAARARARRRQSGGALAEFALVLPILAVLLFGAMDVGWGIYAYHFVASAADRGARYAMVRGSKCNSWGSACPASASDIQTYVRGLAPGGIDTSILNVTTTWTPNNTPGSLVTVTVKYDFGLNLPIVPLPNLSLQSSAEMVISQ